MKFEWQEEESEMMTEKRMIQVSNWRGPDRFFWQKNDNESKVMIIIQNTTFRSSTHLKYIFTQDDVAVLLYIFHRGTGREKETGSLRGKKKRATDPRISLSFCVRKVFPE